MEGCKQEQIRGGEWIEETWVHRPWPEIGELVCKEHSEDAHSKTFEKDQQDVLLRQNKHTHMYLF